MATEWKTWEGGLTELDAGVAGGASPDWEGASDADVPTLGTDTMTGPGIISAFEPAKLFLEDQPTLCQNTSSKVAGKFKADTYREYLSPLVLHVHGREGGIRERERGRGRGRGGGERFVVDKEGHPSGRKGTAEQLTGPILAWVMPTLYARPRFAHCLIIGNYSLYL